MITGLSHLAIGSPNPDATRAATAAFLGVAEPARTLALANVALAFPEAPAPAVAAITFAVADLSRAATTMRRRGIAMAPTGPSIPPRSPASRSASGKRGPAARPRPPTSPNSTISGSPPRTPIGPSPSMARASAALRTRSRQRRLGRPTAFFPLRHPAHRGRPPTCRRRPHRCADTVYGLSWRVTDLPAARARLRHAGFSVSDIRPGRRKGTQVATVHDAPAGIPTLLIEIGASAASI